MLCQECNQKKATVHLTKIINQQKTELYLCETCAWEKGEIDLSKEPFSFHNLLAGILNPSIEGSLLDYSCPKEKTCLNCGLDFRAFSKQGFFGCSHCYDEFSQSLDQLFRRIHGSSRHKGKIPLRSGGQIRVKNEIDKLRHQLQEAVTKEAFEDAALLRDQIKDLEKKIH